MDKILFKEACNKVIDQSREQRLIGTLGEKTLHAVLKNYYEPYADNHEVKLGSFYADIVGEDGIIEIQTRNLLKLKTKLMYFLAVSRVILVHPLPATKHLAWIDNETGEVTNKRKSPKQGKPWDAFYELYSLKPMLKNPNLTICLPMIDLCEYRCLNGWSKDKKRGSTRYDRIPTDICKEVYINTPDDYRQLVPPDLPMEFTTADFKKYGKVSPSTAQRAANILNYMGLTEKIGKRGRSILYKIKDNEYTD